MDNWFTDYSEAGFFGKRYASELAPGESRTKSEVASIETFLSSIGVNLTIADIAGGQGRIANEIIKSDLVDEVFLFDLNPNFIQDVDPNIIRARADMRSIPAQSQSIDVALLMFSSFGYFEKIEDDFRTLLEIHRILKTEGVFLLDLPNTERIKKYFTPTRIQDTPDGQVLYEKSWDGNVLVEKRTLIVADGENVPMGESRMRMYSPEEIKLHLLEVGFSEVSFVDESLDPYDSDNSKRMWVIANK